MELETEMIDRRSEFWVIWFRGQFSIEMERHWVIWHSEWILGRNERHKVIWLRSEISIEMNVAEMKWDEMNQKTKMDQESRTMEATKKRS